MRFIITILLQNIQCSTISAKELSAFP